MANLFSDNFNRPNEELGASADWTERGGAATAVDYEIVSNKAKTIVANANVAVCGHISSSYITTADYSVQVEADSSAGGLFYGVVGRRVNNGANDSNGYFALRYENGGSDQYRLYKRVSGSWTQLGSSYSAAITGNETLKLEMDGTTIKAFLDGTERVSVTDSSLSASGDCGITDATGTPAHSGVIWDNFTADDLSAGITGTGALTATGAAIAGIGEIVKTGTAALQALGAAIAGVGEKVITGTATLEAIGAAISGVGNMARSGTGALQAVGARIQGSDGSELLKTFTNPVLSKVLSNVLSEVS